MVFTERPKDKTVISTVIWVQLLEISKTVISLLFLKVLLCNTLFSFSRLLQYIIEDLCVSVYIYTHMHNIL